MISRGGGTLDLFGDAPAAPPRVGAKHGLQRIELADVTATVVRKRIKYLRLSVHPPTGEVRVSAPSRVSLATIRSFVVSKLDWIRRQQARARARGAPPEFIYTDGERHPVWGQPYRLVVSEREAPPVVELHDDGQVLRLHVRSGSGRVARQALMREWHRSLVETALRSLVLQWESRMGVSVARASVRHMKTRWGSCTPRSQHIRLSSELATKPPACLEYVVVHEMVHLLEPSHNHRFVRLMDRFLPDWRQRRQTLNGSRPSLPAETL